ncbi:hypothetical protein [Streptococcus sp. S784/96/1]|uniref:hypothetical protein n=1 Tax=Streptococcus sp. S784/96/1 TaxID=2653499 RepID=UPI001386B626|nr:hypothetical protein [Streptococcus sp. S784/96/1]
MKNNNKLSSGFQELIPDLDAYLTEVQVLRKHFWMKKGVFFLLCLICLCGGYWYGSGKGIAEEPILQTFSRKYMAEDLIDLEGKHQAFTFKEFLNMETGLNNEEVSLYDFLKTYGKADEVSVPNDNSVVLKYKAKDFKGESVYKVIFRISYGKEDYDLSGIDYYYDNASSDEFSTREENDYRLISDEQVGKLKIYKRDKESIASIADLSTMQEVVDLFGPPTYYKFSNHNNLSSASVTYKSSASEGKYFVFVYNPSVNQFFLDYVHEYRGDN